MDSSTAMDTSEPAKVRFCPWEGIPSLPCALSPCPQLLSLFLQEEDDYDVMQDPEFLQSVLENLPGVDPNNEAIRNAMGSLASQASKDSKDKKEEEKN